MLAFVHGGLVRHKNALATIMQSFIIIGLIMFAATSRASPSGPDIGGGLLGNLSWFALNGVGLAP